MKKRIVDLLCCLLVLVIIALFLFTMSAGIIENRSILLCDEPVVVILQ